MDNMRNKTNDFIYLNKTKETPFETFLRYSNSKEKSSIKIAEILNQYLSNMNSEIQFLDIGTGDGSHIKQVLQKTMYENRINIELVEPSSDLIQELKRNLKGLPKNINAQIINELFEDFQPNRTYDIVLASHLYHIPDEDKVSQYSKMLDLLKPNGKLILVLKEDDDRQEFRMKFKPLLFSGDFKGLTLTRSLDFVRQIKPMPEIQTFQVEAMLEIPYKTDVDDTISIIEFFLNKTWEEIPTAVKAEVMEFIESKNGCLREIEGIAVISKGTD